MADKIVNLLVNVLGQQAAAQNVWAGPTDIPGCVTLDKDDTRQTGKDAQVGDEVRLDLIHGFATDFGQLGQTIHLFVCFMKGMERLLTPTWT